ncbi:GNAT family N-acetyltransferase [Alkalihalobacillus pseudalcaliphilus]|uniref:GNAT family N-acetyltransferase n=1 Tax=Alkalihalobacillus pseudalcaliphilus TaxID=79884 RepID=UPI00064D7A26|nr:N-acetyltransferase [Alkalihalobacillus pseudalcaliphilus]KMK76248.1 hypothetical protein AB990_13645 [Alkalihalobacillus pseudalcaliphilus]
MNRVLTAPTNIRELAVFLEKMNNQKEFHIGFCGEDREEIFDTLMNDFSDLTVEESFIVAYHDSVIMGAIGFDVDIEGQYAEVWGPFVVNHDHSLAQELWNQLTERMPNEISCFSFFINQENQFVQDFVRENGGVDEGSHMVLDLNRDTYKNDKNSDYEVYAEDYQNSFSQLHNEAFPKTYYDAKTILSRLHENHHLYVVKENEKEIKGYVYIEANPKHQEANIEYVAVNSKYRRQGVGRILIAAALKQIFSYASIEEITICVSSDNTAAINLYRSLGFRVKYELVSYESRIKSPSS